MADRGVGYGGGVVVLPSAIVRGRPSASAVVRERFRACGIGCQCKACEVGEWVVWRRCRLCVVLPGGFTTSHENVHTPPLCGHSLAIHLSSTPRFHPPPLLHLPHFPSPTRCITDLRKGCLGDVSALIFARRSGPRRLCRLASHHALLSSSIASVDFLFVLFPAPMRAPLPARRHPNVFL